VRDFLFILTLGWTLLIAEGLVAQSYFASNALLWQGEAFTTRPAEGFVLEITELAERIQKLVLWYNNEPIEWFTQHYNQEYQLTRLQQYSGEGQLLNEWYYLYREDGSLWLRLSADRWLQLRPQGLWLWQENSNLTILRRNAVSFQNNQLRSAFVLDATLTLQEEDFFNDEGELKRRKIYRYGELFSEQFFTTEGRRIEIYYVLGRAVLRQVYRDDQLISEEVIG
jgi:hypothetical protein